MIFSRARLPIGGAVLTFLFLALPGAGSAALRDAGSVEASRLLKRVMEVGRKGPDTAENAGEMLSIARDPKQPAGVRGQALIAFGRVAGRRGADGEDARAVWALRGKIGGLGDPALEALGAIGPAAVPFLMNALRACRLEEHKKGAITNAKAVIEIDEAQLAATSLLGILEQHPSAQEDPDLAPRLIKGLDCGDAGVRQICARALGILPKLKENDLQAVRTTLANDPRADVRSFSAALLAAHAAVDAQSINALERALSDRAEVVRLGSATALIQLKKPARARPVLEKLRTSKDPEIAALAAQVLAR